MYFHFRSLRISFISKITRVRKTKRAANDTSLCSTQEGEVNFAWLPCDCAADDLGYYDVTRMPAREGSVAAKNDTRTVFHPMIT